MAHQLLLGVKARQGVVQTKAAAQGFGGRYRQRYKNENGNDRRRHSGYVFPAGTDCPPIPLAFTVQFQLTDRP